MSASQHRLEPGDSIRRRVWLLAGAVLAGIAMIGAMASTAAAKEQVGLFVAGEEAESEAEQPRFEAEEETYPAYLEGEGDGNHKWVFGGPSLECPVDFFGELSGPASDLKLATFVHYFSCKAPLGLSVTVSANGCEDTVDLLNAGPPYVAEFGIYCPGESPYQFHLGGMCTVSIPAQSGLGEVSLENTGEGSGRGVEVAFDVSGLKYAISGSEACGPGEYENGTYTGSVTLEGFDEQW